jgi:hypothetical protein
MVVWIAVYAFLAMLLGIKILPHANGLRHFSTTPSQAFFGSSQSA